MVSLDRYIVTRDGQIFDKQRDNKPVKVFKSNKYLQCCIYDENGKHVMGVHNVVAQVYCNGWFEGCIVHHKDEDTHNNNADNLECFSLTDHTRLHTPRKYFNTMAICPECNKEFLWTAHAQSQFVRNKTKTGPYCSHRCATLNGMKTFERTPPDNKRKVLCVETGVIYASITEAVNKLGLNYSSLYRVLRGSMKTTHGMHFKYA